MSLPEEPNVMDAVGGIPQQSIPGPEDPGAYGIGLSAAQRIEVLRAENIELGVELDRVRMQLLYSRICHQCEAHGRQSEAQIRHILHRGVDSMQKTYFELAASHKSILCDRVKLQEDVRLGEELVASQRQLIELHEARDRQQQQPTNHEGGPLLQYNDLNQSSQYPPYQLPRQEFIIDPTRLHPLNDIDCSIGSIEPCNPDEVMPTRVAEFENRASIIPVQSSVYGTPAQNDVPGPTHTKIDGNKNEAEEEGARSNKKRKMK